MGEDKTHNSTEPSRTLGPSWGEFFNFCVLLSRQTNRENPEMLKSYCLGFEETKSKIQFCPNNTC